MYTAFSAEISRSNQKKIREALKENIQWRNTEMGIETIAEILNSKSRGWINYYGLYSKNKLTMLMNYLERKITKWIRNKFKISLLKILFKIKEYKTSKANLVLSLGKGVL